MAGDLQYVFYDSSPAYLHCPAVIKGSVWYRKQVSSVSTNGALPMLIVRSGSGDGSLENKLR